MRCCCPASHSAGLLCNATFAPQRTGTAVPECWLCLFVRRTCNRLCSWFWIAHCCCKLHKIVPAPSVSLHWSASWPEFHHESQQSPHERLWPSCSLTLPVRFADLLCFFTQAVPTQQSSTILFLRCIFKRTTDPPISFISSSVPLCHLMCCF